MKNHEKDEQIYNYLNRNYILKEHRFFTKYDNVHEWGAQIIYSISRIFDFDEDFCLLKVKNWSILKGLDENNWSIAYGPIRLKTIWCSETLQDIQIKHGFNSGQQLVFDLCRQLAQEIDSDIIREINKTNIKTEEDFFGVLKCIGYQKTPTIINPNTFKPYSGFVSMNFNDIENERKINHHWKDWVRTRK